MPTSGEFPFFPCAHGGERALMHKADSWVPDCVATTSVFLLAKVQLNQKVELVSG